MFIVNRRRRKLAARGPAMFSFDEFTPEEISALNAALARLCGPDAGPQERSDARLVLLELAQDGVTSVDDLVARAAELLAD